jgi:ligand-binding sensor domain-containing protein
MISNLLTKVFLPFVLCCATLHTIAQESYLRHYSTSDGLPSTETYSVFQDSKGYIWVASDMGVSRFNGYNFKVFTTADGLTDNTVFRFYEDPKGRIWFLTFSGRLCYFFNDSIYGKDLPVNQKIRDFLGANFITAIGGWSEDTFLVATSAGLLKIIPVIENGNTTWHDMQVINRKHTFLLQHGYVTAELVTANTTLFIMYRDKAAPAKLLIPIIYSDLSTLSAERKNSFVLLGNAGPLLIKWDSIEAGIRLIDHYVWASFESDTTFWISVRNKGIGLFSTTNLITPKKKFLQSLTVSSILKDKEEGYWFSTLEDGIFYLPSDKFQHLITKADNPLGNQVFLAKDYQSGIWIVTEKKLFHQDKEHGVVQYFSDLYPHFNKLDNIYFWNLYSDSSGEVWISTSSGITIADSKTQKLKSFIDTKKKTPNIEYNSRKLIKDNSQNIWSLNFSTLRQIGFQSKEVKKTINIPARAQTLCQDFQGNILVGTVNGIYSYTNDSLLYLGDKNPIFKNRFVDLTRYKDEVVGATRGSGIVIMTRDTILQISTANNLLSNMCRSAFVDSSGLIWVATNKGLNSVSVSFKPLKIAVKSFTVADGLPSDDIEQVIKSGDLVWIVTQKEVTSFNPDSVLYNASAPPVYITKLTVDQKPFSLSGPNEFSYSSNFIDINFNGLTYKNAGKQDYKYKLEGLNNAWTYTKNPFVQFTKLPPGDYKFIVTCINSSGKESSAPAVLIFKINAPFYQKWWFGLLVLLFAIIAIAFVSTLIILRIRKQEQIKTEVNRKIANLELHALRAQMNPHFIFNCLNAIQDFILKNDSESAKHYLSSFSKLIRQTLNNSRKQSILLTQEIAFLNVYLELERMRFNNKFDYKISVDANIDASETEVPSMILQPFVENVVRHGKIGSLDGQGQLNINFSVRGAELICVIDDNGIGLNETLRMKKGIEQQGQTHALDIMKERVQTYNEVNALHIRYKISDKSENDSGAKGTRVEFFLPLNTMTH